MILFTTCRCYRELASPVAGGGASRGSPTSSPMRPRQPATSGGGGSGSGSGASKGEFDPGLETVKAARSCSSIITGLLTAPTPPPPPPPGSNHHPARLPLAGGAGGGRAAAVPSSSSSSSSSSAARPHESLTLSARASMAMDMTSSTAFGEAVREALVRSPSGPLRVNARAMLASLSRIDDEIAAEVEARGGDRGGFINQTTVMVSFVFCSSGGMVMVVVAVVAVEVVKVNDLPAA